MKKSVLYLNSNIIPIISLDTVIIGSGCAGFNAADSLYKLGRKDIAIVAEGINMGTSRNTGSDKPITNYLCAETSRTVFRKWRRICLPGRV